MLAKTISENRPLEYSSPMASMRQIDTRRDDCSWGRHGQHGVSGSSDVVANCFTVARTIALNYLFLHCGHDSTGVPLRPPPSLSLSLSLSLSFASIFVTNSFELAPSDLSTYLAFIRRERVIKRSSIKNGCQSYSHLQKKVERKKIVEKKTWTI